jgi:hypothetical protein
MTRFLLSLFLSVFFIAPHSSAQSLDLTIKGNGLSFGNSRRINGVRLNFRDRGRVLVNGVNITIWNPHQPYGTIVNGLALGLPLTGGRELKGVSLGIGVAVEESSYGLTLGIIGAGAGETMTGTLIF